MRLLITYSDISLFFYLHRVLSSKGIEVETAENGGEVSEKLQTPYAPCMATNYSKAANDKVQDMT
jgi:hypothetical protein